VSSVRNRLLNALARVFTGKSLALDWRGIKIFNPQAMQIGDYFSSGPGLWLESVGGKGRLVIGNRVNFSNDVHVGCAYMVTIGDGVLVGSKVLITDHSHGEIDARGPREAHLAPNERTITSKGGVSIGADVWLGDGVCVLPGVTIGAGAIIGANSVVIRDVPAGAVWAGVPARQIWPRG